MKRLIALLLATSSLLCLLAGCGDTPEETVVFEDLPEDFECPLCGVGKDSFSEE